jgi:putative ABC transport system permease protein
MTNLRFSIRRFLQQPTFATVVTLTLALAIGANTAMFSVIEAALLRELPFPEPEDLVILHERSSSGVDNRLSSPSSWAEWQARARSFEELAEFMWWDDTSFGAGDGPAETILTANATPGYFRILGIQPMLGRTFSDVQDANVREVVLSHRLWQRRFGGDPDIIGKSIRFSVFSRQHTVIGVMPPTAYGDLELGWGEAWTAIYANPQGLRTTPSRSRYVRVIGRLKPGVTVAQAQAEVEAIHQQLARENPGVYAGWTPEVESVREAIAGRARPALLLAIGAVLLVLLTACVTVANLLLARAANRQREWAIRIAMGASRWQVFSQLLMDGLLLSLLGAAAGLPLAYAAIRLLVWLQPELPRAGEIAINLPVMAFTLLVALLSAVSFSLAPAIATIRQDIQHTLKDGGRGGTPGRRQHRVRSWLVAAEVACAVVLLVGAGLLLRSFANLLQVHPGFEMDKTLVFDLELPYPELADRRSFIQRFYSRLEALPEVEAVGHIRYFPYHARLWATQVRPQDRSFPDGQEPVVHFNMMAGDYLRALGIPIVRGELPRARPGNSKPDEVIGALVNESLARLLWRDEDPIGKVLREGGNSPAVVTGVVGDIRQRSLGEMPQPEMYVVEDPGVFILGTFVLRTRVQPERVIASVRQVLRELDSNLPVNDLMPLRQLAGRTIAAQRMAMTLLGAFSVVALTLAAVGLYGVIACLVSQRTSEIGTRLAIGARPSHVLWLVTGEGLRLVAIGTAAGLATALIGGRVIRTFLYGVATSDPLIFGAVPVIVSVVALLACLVPARRAMRIDPLVALRAE